MPDIEGGRYECPACGSRHDSVGDKKRHMKEVHPDADVPAPAELR